MVMGLVEVDSQMDLMGFRLDLIHHRGHSAVVGHHLVEVDLNHPVVLNHHRWNSHQAQVSQRSQLKLPF
jgi:hypothetical protein